MRERSRKTPARRGTKFMLLVLGGITLSGAISSLQHTSQSFGNDIKYMSLIENWLSWIAALCFIIGWSLAHRIEVVLLQRQINKARGFEIAYILGIIVFGWISITFVDDPMVSRLDNMILPLLISGHSFRSSTFSDEALRLMDNLFFGAKQIEKEQSA